MRKVLFVLLALIVLTVILLHVCPPFELWLHHVMGWH